ncbi:exosome 3'-_5 exonuclease subunit ski4 (Csl4) [Yamadazyma tenuis]|uniref:Uncharacterized protein n=1 Tax=Candida tenuis (strain ATCC 10573 / BCRC 21748 / CBS 615 / JCM 9827 / NBRC 10315 / NRRL Y-1498 / VKM Y-70) TaxID=590646 RepID=G3B6V9_CANTC|nr:uncharacterized protein CANTEDRAFT_93806 [Yamadazyma tenuis ATCC 10573]EGV63033.1 hypothetical protein CANTEDRAFT_93806 [Yamadazyma tenuis ATCC 10573]WEJ97150.1 exosome 3'->5 exonuclease subunit ski4 (Csl4) [Yamadazyma tenuis]
MESILGHKVVPGQYITPLYKTHGDGVLSFISGKGTTVSQIEHNEKVVPIIVSTVVGILVSQPDASDENKITVSVLSSKYTATGANPDTIDISPVTNNLPKENDIVVVRVTKLNVKQAYCEILSVESSGNVIEDSGLGVNGDIAHQSLGAGGGAQALNNHSTIASSLTAGINAMAGELGESFKGVIRSQDVRSTDRDKVKIIESFKPGDIVRALIISLGDGSNYYLSTARNDLGVIYAKSENGAGDSMFPIDWEHMVCPKTGVVEKRKCAKPIT